MRLFILHPTPSKCFEVIEHNAVALTAVVRNAAGETYFDHAFIPRNLKLVGYSLTTTPPPGFDHAKLSHLQT